MNTKLIKYHIDNFLGIIKIRPFIKAIRILKIIEAEDGHFLSTLKNQALAPDGSALPWFTYPAIEYLNKLDLSRKKVFEYGGGYSTFFWAARAQVVITAESDRKWFNFLVGKKIENVYLTYAKTKKEYLELINSSKTRFDIIVIDGLYRKESIKYALKKLNKGGVIILDNSERDVEVALLLSKSNLIRVDMSGFGPINPYKWQTSFFIDRQYSVKHKSLK